MKFCLFIFILVTFACQNSSENPIKEYDDDLVEIFNRKDLTGWEVTLGNEDNIYVKEEQLVLGYGYPLSGITWQDEKKLPRINYEITLKACRISGFDFFCALTFPYKKTYASLVLGGWSGTISGISSINGKDASDNETTKFIDYDNNRWYKVRLRLTEMKIEAWVDGKKIVNLETKGKIISTRSEVDVSQPLGFATFETEARISNLKLRLLN